MGIPQQKLLNFACASLLALGFQCKFRYNPLNGWNETTRGVLKMVSGSVPPKRVGLTNEVQIRRLVKVTKFYLKFIQIQNYSVFPFVLFDFIRAIYSANYSLKQFLLSSGFPNAVLFMTYLIYMVDITNNILITILIKAFYSVKYLK